MSYRLFYAHGTAAMGVRVLLEELGVEYDLIETDVTARGARSADLLKHNPNGWVPVLVWGEKAMYECGAITVFLCDRHPEIGLAPDDASDERGAFLQWLFYFSSSVQNAFQMTYYPYRFVDDYADEGKVQSRSNSRLREVWQVIDDAIGDKQWILGDKLSAVDIYMFMLTTWFSKDYGHPEVTDFPNVARIAQAVSKRPNVQKVYGVA